MQRLKKKIFFRPSCCPKEGLDPVQPLGNLCAGAGRGQTSSPTSAGAACAMEPRAGEDGEASSAPAPASIAFFSALELYQLTPQESGSRRQTPPG